VQRRVGVARTCVVSRVEVCARGSGMPPTLCIHYSETDARKDTDLANATTVMVLGAELYRCPYESHDKSWTGEAIARATINITFSL
jgi:hypothetical protein